MVSVGDLYGDPMLIPSIPLEVALWIEQSI